MYRRYPPKATLLGFQRNGKFLFFHRNQSFSFKKYIIMGDCDNSFARNCILSDRERPIEALWVAQPILGAQIFFTHFWPQKPTKKLPTNCGTRGMVMKRVFGPKNVEKLQKNRPFLTKIGQKIKKLRGGILDLYKTHLHA